MRWTQLSTCPPTRRQALCVCVCVCTRMCAQSCLSVTPWTVALQAPLSMGFSGREHCSGLPCPSPGHLLDSGIEPASLVTPALSSVLFCCGIHNPRNSIVKETLAFVTPLTSSSWKPWRTKKIESLLEAPGVKAEEQQPHSPNSEPLDNCLKPKELLKTRASKPSAPSWISADLSCQSCP